MSERRCAYRQGSGYCSHCEHQEGASTADVAGSRTTGTRAARTSR